MKGVGNWQWAVLEKADRGSNERSWQLAVLEKWQPMSKSILLREFLADCKLLTAYYKSRTHDTLLPIANCQLPINLPSFS